MTGTPSQTPASPGGDAAGTLTARIAAFAAGAADLPAEVAETWRLHIADTLACAAAGACLPVSAQMRAHALAMGNPAAGAPVIGSPARTSPMMAALCNAFAANALDFDDGFEHMGKGLGHPGASLVAAALAALTPDRRLSGADVLTAVALGAEVNNRLILSVQPSAGRFHEVYGIGQHQAIGAAITYARLTGLPATQMENALGLAASLTSVPSLHKYNWQTRPIITLKDFVAPAAQAGVQAVEMARAGLRGPEAVFDGPQGFWRMVGSDRFDTAIFADDLGRRWLATGASVKTYPACRWIAPALEAFETVLTETGAGLDDIAQITVRSFADVGTKLAGIDPADAIDAQFSLPHLLGCLALRLDPGLPWFTPDALARVRATGLSRRLRIETDADMDAAMRGTTRRPSARVTLQLTDGRSAVAQIDAPLGGSLRPVSAGYVMDKAARLLRQSPLSGNGPALSRLHRALQTPADTADYGAALSALFASA